MPHATPTRGAPRNLIRFFVQVAAMNTLFPFATSTHACELCKRHDCNAHPCWPPRFQSQRACANDDPPRFSWISVPDVRRTTQATSQHNACDGSPVEQRDDLLPTRTGRTNKSVFEQTRERKPRSRLLNQNIRTNGSFSWNQLQLLSFLLSAEVAPDRHACGATGSFMWPRHVHTERTFAVIGFTRVLS